MRVVGFDEKAYREKEAERLAASEIALRKKIGVTGNIEIRPQPVSRLIVGDFIENGTLPDVLAELRVTEGRIEEIWGEYLKLSERRDALRTRCAELTDRMARSQVTPGKVPDSLRRPKVENCHACGRPTREHFSGITYCKKCQIEMEFVQAMERADTALMEIDLG